MRKVSIVGVWVTLIFLMVNIIPIQVYAATSPALSNSISADDFEIIANYDRSFLAENSSGKKLLYLEGDPYERGFAEGYLLPKGVYRMTKEFTVGFFKDNLKLGSTSVDWDKIMAIISRAVHAQEYTIPQEYREEMRGIADGAKSQGMDITYDDVLILNVGDDFLLSLAYQISNMFCNQYMVYGQGTTDGRLYHGRDFMFTTGGGVFSDEALIKVIKPTAGHTLVAAAAPAMVGFPTGLNDEGISCGMDMCPSRLNRGLVSGMGVLLINRNVVQYADSVSEGIDIITNTSRGASWLYGLADGKKPEAVVLETVADSMAVSGEDSLAAFCGAFPELSSTIEMLDYADSLSNMLTKTANLYLRLLKPLIGKIQARKGVSVRDKSYVDPAGLRKYTVVLPWSDPLISKKCETKSTKISLFPLQQERKSDLVAMANHFILPSMNLHQEGLFYHTLVTVLGGGHESEWRYDKMLGNISNYYGSIDRTTAMWLIDFLNPARSTYYGTDTTQAVEGHHVLMDDQSLEMWTLHGYYNQPWVHVDLKWFLNENPGEQFTTRQP